MSGVTARRRIGGAAPCSLPTDATSLAVTILLSLGYTFALGAVLYPVRRRLIFRRMINLAPATEGIPLRTPWSSTELLIRRLRHRTKGLELHLEDGGAVLVSRVLRRQSYLVQLHETIRGAIGGGTPNRPLYHVSERDDALVVARDDGQLTVRLSWRDGSCSLETADTGDGSVASGAA